jgi:hypothetical protein
MAALDPPPRRVRHRVNQQASVLLPLWCSGDIDSLPHLLAEDATVSSPVTDYHGRPQAARTRRLTARVLDIVEDGRPATPALRRLALSPLGLGVIRSTGCCASGTTRPIASPRQQSLAGW